MFLSYQRAFCYLQSVDVNYKNCSTSDEWNRLTGCLNFLKWLSDLKIYFGIVNIQLLIYVSMEFEKSKCI